jgi:hypothetical protein
MWVIQDFAQDAKARQYVNENSKIGDIWTTSIPDNATKEALAGATPIKKFKTKSAAKPYLDDLNSKARAEWRDYGPIFKARFGYSMSRWKAYKHD